MFALRALAKRMPSIGRQVAITTTVPAPVGGLNARDPLADMAPEDAVTLDNWIPRSAYCEVRRGYASHATGMTGNVETVMTYNGPTTSTMFAAVGTAIYDVTSAGAVSAAAQSNLANARFQHVNFATIGGQFLYAVNGADKALLYNGTGWQRVGDGTGETISTITNVTTTATLTTAAAHGRATGTTVIVAGALPADYNGTFTITVTGDDTFTYVMAGDPGGPAAPVGTYTYSPAITGVATTTFANVAVHQTRVWFVEKDSMRVWYLPAASVGGAAQSVDLGSIFKRGGYLQAMGSWSMDSGTGMDDRAVFVSSEGEIAVYQGTDPASAATWALVGVYRIGKAIGRRCLVKYMGDLILIAEDGFWPLSKALLTDSLNETSAISDRIRNAVSDASQLFRGNFGWSGIMFPQQQLGIFHVPATQPYQFVMDTVTGRWCRFTNIPAYSWELLNDELYFGATNAVYKALVGVRDGEANITTDALAAFNYMRSRTALKQWTLIRPLLQTNGATDAIALNITMNVDFNVNGALSTPSLATSPYAVWDDGTWDSSVWGGGFIVQKGWQSIRAIGYCGALHIKSATRAVGLRWIATDYVWKSGGVIG